MNSPFKHFSVDAVPTISILSSLKAIANPWWPYDSSSLNSSLNLAKIFLLRSFKDTVPWQFSNSFLINSFSSLEIKL
jgi:hypothetical protein